jgi:hypothetical protein
MVHSADQSSRLPTVQIPVSQLKFPSPFTEHCTLLSFNREVPTSNQVPEIGYPYCDFPCITQALQENIELVSQN